MGSVSVDLGDFKSRIVLYGGFVVDPNTTLGACVPVEGKASITDTIRRQSIPADESTSNPSFHLKPYSASKSARQL